MDSTSATQYFLMSFPKKNILHASIVPLDFEQLLRNLSENMLLEATTALVNEKKKKR